MGKNQSASNLTNIIQYDNGNISFVSGSTTLMSISSSGAITTTGVISGSAAANATSASYAASASNALFAQTASYWSGSITNALSASYATSATTASYATSLTVAGTLTAQTLVVQTITSSVSTITGSTQFGSTGSNTHVFTGSVNVSPGLAVNNFLSSGSFPFNVSAYTEPYILGVSSSKSDYQQSGTAIRFTSQIPNFTGSSAFLIDILAYSSSAATDVYFGAVAGTTGNGPANFVIGRRTGTSTWVESLRIDISGSVGIGTTNPGSKLTVRGTDSISMLYLGISGSSANGEAVGITFGSSTYDKARIVAYNENSGNAAGYLTLWTGGSPTTTDITERMRITSAGNVGIGTTGPNTRLQILGSSISVGTQSSYALGVGNSSGYDLTFGTDSSYSYIQSWTSKPLNINSQGNNVIFPNSSTSVGIGTTTTSANLHIYGSANFVQMRIENTTAWYALYQAKSSNASNFWQWGSWADGTYRIGQNNVGDYITIKQTGAVGIGTTNPFKTLEVSGRMSTQAIVSGALIAGNIYSNISTSPSFIIICNLNNAAGFSLSGKINAASYTCWNVSDVYIRKDYNALTGTAVITGVAKSGCDFSVVDISYAGDRFIALRFTGNPEIDVLWTGYRLAELFASDGTATVLTSGVTVNSTYASY